jgi:cyclohexadieny/prephenate dehydrogenase
VNGPFERVAILGLGLLGGSVALAARRAQVATTIVGAGRRRAPLEAALARGVVDEVGDVESAVPGADLVVLATPIGAMPRVLEQARPHFRDGAIVTDLGSVKRSVCELVPPLLPDGVHFVGAHPMAGGHEVGVAHSRVDLFDGARCVVSELPDTDARALGSVAMFWRALGAEVCFRDPESHDAEVAWVSHVPHLLAFAFADAIRSAPAASRELAGSGFRDFTRIANSDPEMWAEILCVNRSATAEPLKAFGQSLAKLARAVEEGDSEILLQMLSSARSALSDSGAVPESGPTTTSGGEDPEIRAASVRGGHS